MLRMLLGIVSPKISACVKGLVLSGCASVIEHGYMSGATAQIAAGAVATLVVIALQVASNAAPALLAKASKVQGALVSTSNYGHAITARGLANDNRAVGVHAEGARLL